MDLRFILALLWLAVCSSHAAHTFEAFRVMQLNRNSQMLGSRRAQVNLLAAAVGEVATAPIKMDSLSRKILVVLFDQLVPERIVEIVDKGKASGLLILLPTDMSGVTETQLEGWRAVEGFLLSREFHLPVYCAFQSDSLQSILATLQGSDYAGGDLFQFVVATPEPNKVGAVSAYNFLGFLNGIPPVDPAEQISTIGIVANYDTFAAVPVRLWLECVGVCDCVWAHVVSMRRIWRLVPMTMEVESWPCWSLRASSRDCTANSERVVVCNCCFSSRRRDD